MITRNQSPQGFVFAGYRDLVRLFGEPLTAHEQAQNPEAVCKWHLEFRDGTRAVIYDLKGGGVERARYKWRVQGDDIYSLIKVQQALDSDRYEF